jgi:hypothetical protein
MLPHCPWKLRQVNRHRNHFRHFCQQYFSKILPFLKWYLHWQSVEQNLWQNCA